MVLFLGAAEKPIKTFKPCETRCDNPLRSRCSQRDNVLAAIRQGQVDTPKTQGGQRLMFVGWWHHIDDCDTFQWFIDNLVPWVPVFP